MANTAAMANAVAVWPDGKELKDDSGFSFLRVLLYSAKDPYHLLFIVLQF
jgi:hypothetical protein